MAKAKSKYPGPVKQTPSVTTEEFDEMDEQRRVKDVASALSIYNRMELDNTLRSATFARVRNQLEGGRPFDPGMLEEQGAAWQTNVNFGDSQAARDRTLLPYWKMVNDVPHRIATTVLANTPNAEKYAAAFNECFDEFLDDWNEDYQLQFMMLTKNFVDYGPGLAHWPDKDSPRYKAPNVTRVLFPMNTKMTPESWDVMALVEDVGPSELYRKIRNKTETRRSKEAGWNPEIIKHTICTFKDGNYPDYMDYTRWQDILVNNDIMVSSPYEPIPLIWLFVKQFDGKIGAYAFTKQDGVDDFIFKNEDYEEEFRRIIGAIWYDTGADAMIHSIKGFAVKNYYFSSLLNRTKSRMVDSATMSLGLNFQRESDAVPDESPPIENYGPVTIFPSGFRQLQYYPQQQTAASVITMLENNAAANNSLYREQSQQIEQTDTATQAKILAAQQSETSAASSSIFLAQIGGNIFSEQMRRLRRKGNTDKDAKEFVKRMREKGIPDEVIFETRIRVKAGANAGLANPAMRILAFQEGMALANQPGVNRRWFLENYIANKYGANAVDKALFPEGQSSSTYQARQAMQENVDFGQGHPLPVIPEDDHFVHLQTHLERLQPIAGSAQSGQELSPEQMVALTIGVEHSSEHMQYLSQDQTQKAQFASIRPLFSQIQSVTRGILTKLSAQQQQPPSG